MQFRIPIYSLTGTLGCKQYLAASDCRISSKKMAFEFIDIHKACLVCTRSGCAIWKGYYSRHFLCPVLEYDGRIWIRKGYCKTNNTHFSMLPDFCIPSIRWSKFLFAELLKRKFKSFLKDFDWDISFSTLYWVGALLIKLLRINSHLYLAHPPNTNSVSELQNYTSEEMQKLPLSENFNWNKQIKPSATSPPF